MMQAPACVTERYTKVRRKHRGVLDGIPAQAECLNRVQPRRTCPMKTFVSLSAALITATMLTVGAQAASPQAPASTTTPAASMQTADTMMVVSHGYAHVRKEANTKSQILATLKKGT